jgi:hypothetical protein
VRSSAVIQVPYGDGVADRIRAAAGGKVDAFIDAYGPPAWKWRWSSASAPNESTPSAAGPALNAQPSSKFDITNRSHVPAATES